MRAMLNIQGRGLRHAALALFLFLLLGGLPGTAALAAMPDRGMAVDAFNSVTKPPASRQSNSTFGSAFGTSPGSAQTGPVEPKQPKAPVVPGATNSKGVLRSEPLPLRQSAPKAQPEQGSSRKTAAHAAQAGQARPQVLTLTHGDAERRALVTLPKAAQAKKGQAAPKVPVIIFLHGAGGSAAQAMRQTNLAGRAAAAGFLAVFPEGLGPPGADNGGQTWNAWNCCGYARDNRVDDVGFLSALIARLRADFGADPGRIHLAGFSNGAMLASRFVLERPGVAASLASVAGYLPCDAPAPSDSLPVLLIHGARDQVARFAPTKAYPATGRFCEDSPARAQAEFWVRSLELVPKAQVLDDGKSPARMEEYAPQRKGARGLVRFVIVKDGGHAWPGGPRERYRYCDLPTSGVDATGLLLEFAKRAGAPAQEKAKPEPAPAKKKRPTR